MAADPLPIKPLPVLLYCVRCAAEVREPLRCGDCSAMICRRCGCPLEMPEDASQE